MGQNVIYIRTYKSQIRAFSYALDSTTYICAKAPVRGVAREGLTILIIVAKHNFKIKL